MLQFVTRSSESGASDMEVERSSMKCRPKKVDVEPVLLSLAHGTEVLEPRRPCIVGFKLEPAEGSMETS